MGAPRRRAEDEEGTVQGLRILLADDNPINRKVALRVLERDGHRVSEVDNGRDALRALEENDFDLVLMDVQMPEMDGLEATRRIRAADSAVRNREIPVIAVTAHAMRKDREACLAAGMDDYASKPIQPKILREVIARNAPVPSGKAPGGGSASPGAAGSDAEIPVFDRAGMLERLDGDEELCVEIIEVFLLDTPGRMDDLDRAASEGDAARVEYLAHSIKGAAGNIGADRVAALSHRIEKAGAGAEPSKAADLVGRLREELRLLNAALDEAGMLPAAPAKEE